MYIINVCVQLFLFVYVLLASVYDMCVCTFVYLYVCVYVYVNVYVGTRGSIPTCFCNQGTVACVQRLKDSLK